MREAVQTSRSTAPIHDRTRPSPFVNFSLSLTTAFFAATAILQAQDTQPAGSPTTSTAPASAPAEDTRQMIQKELVTIVGVNPPDTRRQAASNILRVGSDDAMTALATVLTSENNEDAKLAICNVLVEANAVRPGLSEPLLQLMAKGEPPVQKAAYAALAGYTDENVVERRQAWKQNQVEKLLIERLQACMEELYELTPDDQRPARLQEWLKGLLSYERRFALDIVHTIVKSGTSSNDILDQVRSMLGDEDEAVRVKVVEVLREALQPGDAALLRGMLDRPQPKSVKIVVFSALGKLGDTASLPACVQGLSDPDPTVAAEAASAIGKLALKAQPESSEIDAAAKALLQRAAPPSDNAKLRGSIVEAMSVIARPQRRDFLPVFSRHASAADEGDPGVRQAAVRGLGNLGDTTQLSLITKAMGDADPGVRDAASAAILKLGDSLRSAGQHKEEIGVLESGLAALTLEKDDLRAILAVPLVRAYFANPGPEKAIELAATLRPAVREKVADQFLNYAKSLQGDPPKAQAFLTLLQQQIPDLFGATWAPKFKELLATFPAPSTQPETATAPG